MKRVNEKNRRYFYENEETLEEEYGGQTIVILDQEIVDTREFTADFNELREFVQSLREEYGMETVQTAFLTHVPDPDQALIL